MRNIAVIDDSFDTGLAAGYELLVQFSDSFFSSLVLDRHRNLFLAFKSRWFPDPLPYASMAFQLRSLINSDMHLTLPYQSVSFQYVTPLSVLMPAPLYRNDKQENYFRFSAGLPADSRILHRRIPQADAVVVFAIPEEVDSLVRFAWPDVRLLHQWCPQVTASLADAPGRLAKSIVLACIHRGHADLTVVSAGKLLLQNSFAVRNLNDLAFYILYLYDQFNLSQDDTPLVLSGYPGLFPELTETMTAYIRNISTAGLPEIFSYSPVFSSLQAEELINLINLLRCV